mgnify:FL=1
MEHAVLRKRLNTYKTSEGRLQHVSDEVVMEVLRAWENWSGSTADLYREIGLSRMQMVIMIKKGKKLVKSGVVVESEFHEIKQGTTETTQPTSICGPVIEVNWHQDKVIRFSAVDQLVDFLKKVS